MAREFPLVWDRVLECAGGVAGEGQNVQRCEDAVGTHTSLMGEGWVQRYMRYEDKIPYQFMSDQAWGGEVSIFAAEPFL